MFVLFLVLFVLCIVLFIVLAVCLEYGLNVPKNLCMFFYCFSVLVFILGLAVIFVRISEDNAAERYFNENMVIMDYKRVLGSSVFPFRNYDEYKKRTYDRYVIVTGAEVELGNNLFSTYKGIKKMEREFYVDRKMFDKAKDFKGMKYVEFLNSYYRENKDNCVCSEGGCIWL